MEHAPTIVRTGARAGAGARPPLDVVARLRAPVDTRPPVDRGLAGGLRAWLEDGVATVGPLRAGTLVVHRGHLGAFSTRPRTHGAALPPSAVVDVIVRTAFRQLVSLGAWTDPFDDALCALRAQHRGDEILEAVGRMGRRERAALRHEVRAQACGMARDWRPLPHAWLPRTADRITVPLGAAQVVLAAIADLALGTPSAGSASVCLVGVRAAGPGPTDARARRFLALLETLRSGAPPFRVATYYPAVGHLDVDDITDELLAGAVVEAIDAIQGAARAGGAR